MSEEDIGLFHDSLERCFARAGFFDCFRALFLGSSAAVAEKFEHVSPAKQAMALQASFYLMMSFAPRDAAAPAYMRRMARRHSREELDIEPELYDLWLVSLTEAVKAFDSEFTSQTEVAWRRMMQPGLAFMKARY